MRANMLVLTTAIAFVTACAAKKESPSPRAPQTPNQVGNGTADAVTYVDDIAPLIQTFKCASCHATQQSGPDLDTYAQVKAEAQAILASVKAKRMPTSNPKLDTTQITLLTKWIEGGRLERSTTPAQPSTGTGTTPSVVTYDGQVKAWVKTNCLSCHNTGGSTPIMATKAQVQTAASAMLYAVKTKQTMPQGKTPMVRTEYNVFQDWIAQGKK
jgi:uncharacterized membrane protein